jgi:hypothetical protein
MPRACRTLACLSGIVTDRNGRAPTGAGDGLHHRGSIGVLKRICLGRRWSGIGGLRYGPDGVHRPSRNEEKRGPDYGTQE